MDRLPRLFIDVPQLDNHSLVGVRRKEGGDLDDFAHCPIRLPILVPDLVLDLTGELFVLEFFADGREPVRENLAVNL